MKELLRLAMENANMADRLMELGEMVEREVGECQTE